MGTQGLTGLALASLLIVACTPGTEMPPTEASLPPTDSIPTAEPSQAAPTPTIAPETPSPQVGGGAAVVAVTPLPGQREQAILAALAGVSRSGDWTPWYELVNGVPMTLVPTGCFIMGSEIGAGDEQPPHQVCFTEPFWLDLSEVTNGQFEQFGGQAASDPSWDDLEQPRDSVDWFEAAAFCEQRGARLPTEAEWEYAATGPDNLIYPWGNNLRLEDVVWDRIGVEIVGSNPGGDSWVGASDLGGNVWEWVSDWYGDRYYESLDNPVLDPQGPETGTHRVRKGGGYLPITESADELRAANRDRDFPGVKGSSVGFRCALDFTP